MIVSLAHRLQGRRLTLRRFGLADAPRVAEILGNWNVARMLRRASYPASVEVIAAWLAIHEVEWLSGRTYRFAAFAEGRIIGCADGDEIDVGVGELGYWFDEASWGRGFAGEAAALVLDFAVKTLGLRLVSGHAVENVASGRILSRLGFSWKFDELVYYPFRREEVPYRRYEFGSA